LTVRRTPAIVVVVMTIRRRVLVVDEDPLVRLAVDRQLDALGWDAVTVNTGEEAIRVVEMGLLVDVLLTDLRLPDLDGLDVAWAVTRVSPRTRVAFTAAAAPDEPLEPRHAPLLLKPFSTSALSHAIEGAVLIGGP
jgi:CheY-like chemotaxis protein